MRLIVGAVPAKLSGDSDEKAAKPADATEPTRVLILNRFAYELRAALAEPIDT